MDRGTIALRIAVVASVIVLFETGDDPIAAERPETTHVGVVGSTYHGEAVVVAILVAVDLLPPSVGISQQRVVDAGQCFEGDQL